MLTITDFIYILNKYYKEAYSQIDELEEHSLETWKGIFYSMEFRTCDTLLLSLDVLDGQTDFIYISPDSSLLDAVRMLLDHRIHRLPVVDVESGNVLYIITHKRLLKFLFLYVRKLNFLKSICLKWF